MKGHLRERPEGSGVWRLRVYAGRGPDGRPRYATQTWKNMVKGKLEPGGQRRAESALARFVTEVGEGRHPSTDTLGQLLDRWVAFIEPRRSPTTMAEYRRKIDRDIRPALGDHRLDRLSAFDLDTWYASKLADGLSPTSVHHFHAIIHAALVQAEKWGLVASNVADRASAPPARSQPVRVPALEAVQALMAASEERTPQLSVLLLLAATTGARRSELCRLRWSDVDWESSTLRIRGTKTETSYRTVSLDDVAYLGLELHRRRQAEWAAAAGTELDPDPYIGATDPEASTPYRPNSITQATRRLSKNGVSPHRLRHFTATQMIGAGADIRTVAGRLGHADATTTLRVYSHFIPERDKDAAARLGALVGRTPRQLAELERREAEKGEPPSPQRTGARRGPAGETDQARS